MIRRTRLPVLAALASAALLAALTIGPSASARSTHAAATPVQGGDLVIARTQDSTKMDATSVFDNESIWVLEQMMETLYTVTPDGKDVKPWLATSYDLSPDKQTYTFHLRHGVLFHTGKEMTSADVKFSLDAARNTKDGWGYIDGAIKSVTAKDKYTVVVKTKFKWAPMVADIALFSNAIVPKGYDGKTKAQFYNAPVGTGPFKWDHWTKGKELKLVKFDKYWQKGKPLPEQRHLDVRGRRQHAPAAAQGRPDPDQRVPGLGAGQAAAEHLRRHDEALPVDAHRLRALQPALQALPGRARAPCHLVPDRPQGARQGHPLRQRHAGQLVPPAAGAVLRRGDAGPHLQPPEGQGGDGQVERPQRLHHDVRVGRGLARRQVRSRRSSRPRASRSASR